MVMSKTEEFRQKNTRRASALQVGGFRPSFHPLASNICRAPVGLPGEQWPRMDGAALAFVCQLDVASAPAVPELLRDVATITLFAGAGALGRENGENWVLRAYGSTDGLTPLERPADAPKLGKPFECLWEECEDHPNADDPELVRVPGARAPRSNFDNLARTKIGGYASTIQGELWWAAEPHPATPRFCLQVNSEEKAQLAWGHGGTLYFARGTAAGQEHRWFLDWQCF